MNDLRVLMVDDEQSILSALERRLSENFQVTCSRSAIEAIEILKQSNEFAVVVTDMRMPDIDGLQFIQLAREVSPDSMYIMLTGTQDLKTVVQATNDGRVFRYLTKPCPIEDLSASIQAGIDRYYATESERALLKSTFAGVFEVMVELLTASHPIIGAIHERIKAVAASARTQLGWPENWEAAIASRMSMVGFTILHENQSQELIDASQPFTPDTFETLRRGFETSRKLMAKIPRLGRVCKVIDAMCGSEDALDSDQHTYGTLLGMSVVYVIASRKAETDPREAVRASFPNAAPELLESIHAANEKFLAARDQAESVSIKHLMAGMVLANDLVADGTPVLRVGDVITERVRDHLSTIRSLPSEVSAFLHC